MKATHSLVENLAGQPSYQVECRPNLDGQGGSIWTPDGHLKLVQVGSYHGHVDPALATEVTLNGIMTMMGDVVLRFDKL